MRANKIPIFLALTAGIIAGLAVLPAAQAQTSKKPNILVIWGDDIGTENISYYNRGNEDITAFHLLCSNLVGGLRRRPTAFVE